MNVVPVCHEREAGVALSVVLIAYSTACPLLVEFVTALTVMLCEAGVPLSVGTPLTSAPGALLTVSVAVTITPAAWVVVAAVVIPIKIVPAVVTVRLVPLIVPAPVPPGRMV